MAANEGEKAFAAHVVEMLQGVGPAYSKRMFGGFGVFLGDMMFGLIADNELYLKADADNREKFDALGLQAFTYKKQGKDMQMGYRQAPEDALEDLELMTQWGSLGFGAALRAAAKKQRKKKVS
jgi:DNA transformation protein